MRREPMAVKIKNSDIAMEVREKKLISIALCSCNNNNILKDLATDANYSLLALRDSLRFFFD